MNSWVIDDFLLKSQFNEMKSTFPIVKNEGVRAMNDLYCSDKEYIEHVYSHPAWMAFHDAVFSSRFWEVYFPEVRQFEFKKSYKEPRSGTLENDLKPFLYSRIDIGVATSGYGIHNGGRGVHIDNRQRIISGLLYFTDQSELDGGEFLFCTKQGEITRKVPLKENRCVLSHQTKDAWHMVQPLRKGVRRFVYFSLNATWPFYERD